MKNGKKDSKDKTALYDWLFEMAQFVIIGLTIYLAYKIGIVYCCILIPLGLLIIGL